MTVEFSNLACVVTAFLYRNESAVASRKLPVLAVAYGFCLGLTAWVLRIMLPMNKRLAALAVNLEKYPKDEKSAEEFREVQDRWRRLNYGKVVMLEDR